MEAASVKDSQLACTLAQHCNANTAYCIHADPNVYPDPDLATICRESEDESDLGDLGGDLGPSDMPMPLPAPLAVASSPAKPAQRPAARGRRRLAQARYSRGAPLRIWPPWPVCPAQETLPAAVTFRYSFMAAGTHVIRFKAIAATPGAFVLPPVKAYVSKQPEIMGLSPAGMFTVCGARAGGGGCNTTAAAAAPPPRRCPGDCSGNGVCNLASGVCVCDAGFGGATCGALASV